MGVSDGPRSSTVCSSAVAYCLPSVLRVLRGAKKGVELCDMTHDPSCSRRDMRSRHSPSSAGHLPYYSALYAKCPCYIVLYMQCVLIVSWESPGRALAGGGRWVATAGREVAAAAWSRCFCAERNSRGPAQFQSNCPGCPRR